MAYASDAGTPAVSDPGARLVAAVQQAGLRAVPEAFADQRIRPVSAYPRRLLASLRACAPPGVDDPTVVVLTPGVFNSAYVEHALLARSMGTELVEGRDLVCSGNRVRMLTTEGERRVDVVYRRVDDEFLDPLELNPASRLGVPGILDALRNGSLVMANMPGAVARTSTFALNNATLPFAIKLADLGAEAAMAADPHLAAGLNVSSGKIRNQAVAEALDLEFVPA